MFNFFYILLSRAAKNEPSTQGSLSIHLSNLKSTKGVLNVAITNTENGQFENPFREEIYPFNFVVDGQLVVEDLPFGTYAIRIFHDENCNGQIDTNSFGYSMESIGYSGNTKSSGHSPDFGSTRFDFKKDSQQISVSMHDN